MTTKFISTRGTGRTSIDEAILGGLAKDGGLYIPEYFPKYELDSFYNEEDLIAFSACLLAPFFTESQIEMSSTWCSKVFTFPMPLKSLAPNRYVLELFHGPTLSFKDFGARFFAQCLEHLGQDTKTLLLVATSGDTGGAVASAFHRKKGVESFILFPKDKISFRQQAQITSWDDNIHALAVTGTFDQCQQLVKQALAHQGFTGILTTANSINIARLLPQVVFYAYSSIQVYKKHKESVNFIIPSGNLGNVTACYWAKKMGFPIDEILIATNANKAVTDYLATGVYQARPAVCTLANAMDVGDPSNLERLTHLYPDFKEFKRQLNVAAISDDDIKKALIDCHERYNYLICPHTATAYQRLQTVNSNRPWVIVATAHPAKFHDIIEPLLDINIPVPEQLGRLLIKKQRFTTMEPLADALNQLVFQRVN